MPNLLVEAQRISNLQRYVATLAHMIFLQALYNLSDEECEHQVLDRCSFQCFCLLDGVLHIPDARTLWAFKQNARCSASWNPLGERVFP